VYAWSSTVGGTFGNAANASTYFKAPVVTSATTGNVICTVTDACGRKNFVTSPVSVSTAVLPIELKNFKASIVGADVKLDWTTATETNNSYFTIERSADGTTYEEITRLEGSGNSTYDISYTYTDLSPSAHSTLYYRLRQTDFDGKFETFDPAFVNFDDRSGKFEVVSTAPNPFSGKIRVIYTSGNAVGVNYSLINQSGVQLKAGEAEASEGNNELLIDDLEGLPSGIYYLIFIHEEDKKIIKLLKS
jgi:hypothetical protein